MFEVYNCDSRHCWCFPPHVQMTKVGGDPACVTAVRQGFA